MVKLKYYFKILLFIFSIGLFLFSLFSFFTINNLHSFNKIILVNNTNEDLTCIYDNLGSVTDNENSSFTAGDKLIIKISSNNFSLFLKNLKGEIIESKKFFIDFQHENNKTVKILISKRFDDKFDFLLE